MAKKKGRDRDVVSEFHEDARWSSYTNSAIRWHHRGGRGGLRSDLGRTARIWILAAVVVVLLGMAWSIVSALLTRP